MTAQPINAEDYATHGRFVAQRAKPLLDLLDARPNESILDLGCGDGVLTKQIADLGCKVVGLDLSAGLVASARSKGLHVIECDAANMEFNAEFDAVFSNGALHWMKDADRVLRRVAKALRSKGRFVASMSGHNSIKLLHDAFIQELNRRGYDGEAFNPWYFPTADEYAARLTAAGFDVSHIALDPTPVSIPGNVMIWVTALSGPFTAALPQEERDDYLDHVRKRIEAYRRESDERLVTSAFALSFAARLIA